MTSVLFAQEEGYRPVIVPDDIAQKLGRLTELNGQPMFDLAHFQQAWNDGFSFEFVDPADLTEQERAVFDLTKPAAKLAKVSPRRHGVTASRRQGHPHLRDDEAEPEG